MGFDGGVSAGEGDDKRFYYLSRDFDEEYDADCHRTGRFGAYCKELGKKCFTFRRMEIETEGLFIKI